MRRTGLLCMLGAGLVLMGALLLKTRMEMGALPARLAPDAQDARKVQVLDRNGVLLSVTYQNHWNFNDTASLHEMPPLLVQAFVESEDRRFYEHGGVDWPARLHAVWQNLSAFRAVRGASTISEQVVRMLHPRPRTIWSRWIEGIEARDLERRFPKAEILEFYLNQVPYAHQRRGVVQAARFYFDRDLNFLNTGEILALVVLVRAPARMDLRRDGTEVKAGVARLAAHMKNRGFMSEEQRRNALEHDWSLATQRLPVEAGHFVQYIQSTGSSGVEEHKAQVHSTVDGALQTRVQKILDTRLRDLREEENVDGAVLVVDHVTDHVLAWVNGGGLSRELPGGWIDAVITPRQPGSTLKPFLYALTLESGWTPATLIDDTPLSEPVGSGLHSFHNYSRTHYGLLRLRDALGNSLNVPAVRAIQFVGRGRFLETLHALGFQSLNRPAEHYGDGLALGDGEVSLLELVRAYAVLARQGEFRPLKVTLHEQRRSGSARQVYERETAVLIGDILSDPQARRLEFGDGNLLRFPVQTAVKTGTSSDHRDAWAVGFSHRHSAGVWMGNLERKPTRGITGASGPGLVLRAVFAELNRLQEPQPLPGSPWLTSVTICRTSGLAAGPSCPSMRERFRPGDAPKGKCPLHGTLQTAERVTPPFQAGSVKRVTLLQPTQDLQLRMDPRVPDELEAFPFVLAKELQAEKVEWFVDGKVAEITGHGTHRFLWKLARGVHLAQARIWNSFSDEPLETPAVRFVVK